jgi:hypothetical protein
MEKGGKFVAANPGVFMTDKKKEHAELDVCTKALEFAEHARPNEPAQDACDDGRAGTKSQKKKGVSVMTDENRNEEGEDLVEKRKKERQETMDKMSIGTSEAHTYDKNKSEDGEKCS